MKYCNIRNIRNSIFLIICLMLLFAGVFGGLALRNSIMNSSGNLTWVVPTGPGVGTEEEPFLIWDAEDFNFYATSSYFASSQNAYRYKQMDDFSTDVNLARVNFYGEYEGGGHTITITQADANDALFNQISSDAVVKNLNLNIADCVSSNTSYCGAFALYNVGTLLNCSFSGAIITNATYTGGLVGSNTGIIKNCKNLGNINTTLSSAFLGGIAGLNLNGIVNSSLNVGAITCNNASSGSSIIAGGIVGSRGTVMNCYNTGAISVTAYQAGCGGIVGNQGIISTSYNLGTLSAVGSYLSVTGAISCYEGSASGCYYVSNCGASYGIGGLNVNTGTTAFSYNSQGTYELSAFAEWQSALNSDGGIWEWRDSEEISIDGSTITASLPRLFWEFNRDYKQGTPRLSIASADDFNYNAIEGYFLDESLSFTQTANITQSGALFFSDLYANYNGGGHTISITGSEARDSIFCNVGKGAGSETILQNLNVNISTGVGRGMLRTAGVAWLNYGTISNCSFSGSLTALCQQTGGIAAYNAGTLDGCTNSATITVSYDDSSASYASLGGVCGASNGTINKCNNAGNIAATAISEVYSMYVGGVVGQDYKKTLKSYNTATISCTGTSSESIYCGGVGGSLYNTYMCYNTGSVIANNGRYTYCGGVAGSTGNIYNSYNTATVTVNNAVGTTYIGGIAGGPSTRAYNCYSLGKLTVSGSGTIYKGAIAGRAMAIYGCYWVSNCGASYAIAGTNNNLGATSFSSSSSANYTTSTFSIWSTFLTTTGNVWIWQSNTPTIINGTSVSTADLPHLYYEAYDDSYLASAKTSITSAADFNFNAINLHFLNKDLSFTQTASFSSSSALLYGDLEANYDGGGYTISITGSSQRIGLFRLFNNQKLNKEFKNLTINYSSGVNYEYGFNSYCGGIIAGNYGKIINCHVKGTMTSGATYTGGIVAALGAEVSNCSSTANITVNKTDGTYMAYGGGIVACVENSEDISNCFNSGNVYVTNSQSSAYSAGILAQGKTDIIDCYNTGTIKATYSGGDGYGSAYAGGIATAYGWGGTLTITNCYNTGNITASAPNSEAVSGGICALNGVFSNCYNLGTLSTTGSTVYKGGICGEDGTSSNSYWVAGGGATYGLASLASNVGATSFAAASGYAQSQSTFAFTWGTYGSATSGWVWGASKSMKIRGSNYSATSLPRLWWETL